MNKSIYVSIASYRDVDLINTVLSAYNNAVYKDNLYFSIYSQESDAEHVDLSFIPANQMAHICVPHETALGPCYARHMANTYLTSDFDFFIQVDSHSRFEQGWDMLLLHKYEEASVNKWGSRIILSAPCSILNVSLNEETNQYEDTELVNLLSSYSAVWDEGERVITGDPGDYEGDSYGQEVFYICAGFLFCPAKLMLEVPYDPNLYFWGEESTLAIRAYTRGIKIISPPISVIYSNFNRHSTNRPLHWEDNESAYSTLNKTSKVRAGAILSGKPWFGVYGIDSRVLYEEYQQKTGLDLVNQAYLI
jgi:hypothetical protein